MVPLISSSCRRRCRRVRVDRARGSGDATSAVTDREHHFVVIVIIIGGWVVAVHRLGRPLGQRVVQSGRIPLIVQVELQRAERKHEGKEWFRFRHVTLSYPLTLLSMHARVLTSSAPSSPSCSARLVAGERKLGLRSAPRLCAGVRVAWCAGGVARVFDGGGEVSRPEAAAVLMAEADGAAMVEMSAVGESDDRVE